MMTRVLHRLDDLERLFSFLPTAVLLASTIILAFQAADRRVPFAMLEVYPSEARAGGEVTIHSRVWRDLSRECSVKMSRWSIDAANARSDYPLAEFPAEMIRKQEEETPGELKVTLQVGRKAAPGTMRVFSHLKYRCNLGHWLSPVEVTTIMPFTVLP